MSYWLLKTEPSTYSYADLERDGQTVWDGIANPVALKHLRSMRVGDEAFVYHTGGEKRIVGIAKVTQEAHNRPKDNDLVIDIAAVKPLARPVTLAEVKADGRFADWELVRIGRLSVMPVREEWWRAVVGWK